MASTIRSAMTQALRSATQFVIPLATLEGCLTATPTLVVRPERIAALESAVRRTLLGNEDIPPGTRSAILPVLGNIAEAVAECLLIDHGWQPVYDDSATFSSGHGVDLLMLDPSLERLVAVEVKSTVQRGRWPGLASGRREQLSASWFDSPGNVAMVEWGVNAADISVMVAQVHLRRRLWRGCIARDPESPHPFVEADQLSDLSWLT